MLSGKEKMLLDALSQRAGEEGVEIVTLEIVGARKSPTIRVYIDTDHGVSFDELSAAQSWIDKIMDEIDPFPGAYMLEVSSPGIDRPLRTAAHFEKHIGETAQVKMARPVDGRANFTGTIESVDGDLVKICCDGQTYELALCDMRRANLKGTFEFK